VSDADVTKTAKQFIDSALAARGHLGYSAHVSKKSYGRAVSQAASVFETLEVTTRAQKPPPTAVGASVRASESTAVPRMRGYPPGPAKGSATTRVRPR
jgi:hypothetical protein